jgi:hypothetical protein
LRCTVSLRIKSAVYMLLGVLVLCSEQHQTDLASSYRGTLLKLVRFKVTARRLQRWWRRVRATARVGRPKSVPNPLASDRALAVARAIALSSHSSNGISIEHSRSSQHLLVPAAAASPTVVSPAAAAANGVAEWAGSGTGSGRGVR